VEPKAILDQIERFGIYGSMMMGFQLMVVILEYIAAALRFHQLIVSW
jgi:hypothetical protein